MRLLRTAILVGLMPSAALAGASAWQDLAPDVRVRLITSDVVEADGTTLAALELDMPEDHKTYWAFPGETGLPTQFDLSASAGISSHRPLWPLPMATVTSGYVDYVYKGATVLPLVLTLDGTAEPNLSLTVRLGVCQEVCVPAQARFELPIDLGRPDGAQALRIRQALTDVPIPWDGPEPPIRHLRWNEVEDALELTIADSEIDAGTIVAWIGDRHLFGPAQVEEGGVVRLPRLVGEGAVAGPVELAFDTPQGPYSVSFPVSP